MVSGLCKRGAGKAPDSVRGLVFDAGQRTESRLPVEGFKEETGEAPKRAGRLRTPRMREGLFSEPVSVFMRITPPESDRHSPVFLPFPPPLENVCVPGLLSEFKVTYASAMDVEIQNKARGLRSKATEKLFILIFF